MMHPTFFFAPLREPFFRVRPPESTDTAAGWGDLFARSTYNGFTDERDGPGSRSLPGSDSL